MSGTTRGRWALAFIWAGWAFFSGAGCAHTLFSDPNDRMIEKAKQYYGDSVIETTERRKQEEGFGFGYPSGPAEQ